MRVAWLHNSGPRETGSGIFMWQLLDAVASAGVSVTGVAATGLSSLRGNAAVMARVRKEVADHDIVHVQYGSLIGFLGSRLDGRKVVTLRGSDVHTVPFAVDPKYHLHGAAARLLTKISLPRYDHIIVCSNRMADEVKRMGRAHALEVIPDGIDFDRFHPMERMEARRRLGAGSDTRPWVLFSSFTDQVRLKRKPLADAAVARARRALPDIVMRYMYGVPHELVPVHVSAADVVLLTSTHEGWPNIVKEGLACNVPFVSTDVSDLAPLAAKSRSCRVTPPTAEALGAALVRAIKEGREVTLRDLIANMDMRLTAQRIIGLYTALLSAPRPVERPSGKGQSGP